MKNGELEEELKGVIDNLNGKKAQFKKLRMSLADLEKQIF